MLEILNIYVSNTIFEALENARSREKVKNFFINSEAPGYCRPIWRPLFGRGALSTLEPAIDSSKTGCPLWCFVAVFRRLFGGQYGAKSVLFDFTHWAGLAPDEIRGGILNQPAFRMSTIVLFGMRTHALRNKELQLRFLRPLRWIQGCTKCEGISWPFSP